MMMIIIFPSLFINGVCITAFCAFIFYLFFNLEGIFKGYHFFLFFGDKYWNFQILLWR